MSAGMLWHLVRRADPAAARLSDRHYSRQSPGSGQFTPPGRVMVLVLSDYSAVWASSWPKPEYVNRVIHPCAWTNTIFRNESSVLSSLLITQAVAATRAVWGDNAAGMVTMVDESKVRHKRDPGRCFRKAGFRPSGRTQERGLLVLHLALADMPAPELPLGAQLRLFEEMSA